MEFSSQQFADFTGISKKSVQNYRKQGMPSIKKNKYYSYTFEAIQWLYDNGIKEVTGTNTETKEQTPKYRKDLADAKLKEHALGIREKKFILVSEVKEEFFNIGRITRDSFQMLGNKIAPLLVKKESHHDIKYIIDREVNKILQSLVNCSTPTKQINEHS